GSSTRLKSRLYISFVASGLIAGITFSVFPEIDLSVSRAFYRGSDGFVGQSLAWVRHFRVLFIIIFWVCAAGSLIGLWMTRRRARSWLGLTYAQWLFLVFCIAVGPGVVVNLALKDHWGRARPKQIAEFGGRKTFTPPLLPSSECAINCSFVAGEPASIFLPFFAAALIAPQWSTP